MKKQFECSHCGTTFPVWQGKCSGCEEWNSLIEVSLQPQKNKKGPKLKAKKPVRLNAVEAAANEWCQSGIWEVDHVLGKGFVRGSVTLLGGEPGIGKSTLSLQLAQKLAERGETVLYISGEESENQVFLRANRTGNNSDSLFVLSETNMDSILESINTIKPTFLILDSIQVVSDPALSAIGGSVSQVRHCAQALISIIKDSGMIGILIGHITKEGNLAGPKVLEHMVDTILYLEGERHMNFRILRCYKNRFSTTDEIGVFKMQANGLIQVAHASELFIDKNTLSHPGSVVSAICEGSRPILVEVQALVVHSGFGNAKRNFVGVHSHRAHLIIATIEKILRLNLSNQDIFLNIIGGMTVNEPALDLAIVVAILSSLKETPLKGKIGVFGEVGLAGEIRGVPRMDQRLQELSKMGFESAYVPEISGSLPGSITIKPIYLTHLQDVLNHLLLVPSR